MQKNPLPSYFGPLQLARNCALSVIARRRAPPSPSRSGHLTQARFFFELGAKKFPPFLLSFHPLDSPESRGKLDSSLTVNLKGHFSRNIF